MLASLGPSVHNTNTDLYWHKPPGEPEGDGGAFGETADWLKFDTIQIEPLACHQTDLIMDPLQTVSVQWFERNWKIVQPMDLCGRSIYHCRYPKYPRY